MLDMDLPPAGASPCPVWPVRPLGLNVVRRQAETMELETRRFYERAATQVATIVAVAVVAAELAAISYIRHRFMDTPFLSAAFQVVVGGVRVFLAGILIGSS